MSPRPLRVAVWQCRSLPGDVAGNLARLADAASRAAGAGADVLVTPEMFVTGYDIGALRTAELAEPADGPIFEAVAGITRRTGVAVAYGYPELLPDGRIANAAQLVDHGRSVGAHRKAHLFGGLDSDRFAPGERPTAFDFRGRRVGMLICYDVEFPEAVRSLAVDGAEAVLVPTANMVPYALVSTVLVRARAYENGVAVAYANYCGAEGSQVYAGLSTVCGPDGAVLALAAPDGEDLLVADLVGEGQPYLRDRRPDLY
ncbi:carbon-nitrogen hydrolase family protein [Microbacterium paludicola]|uniref:carbon-nitrogen hydrolase family protein n=1 Tax=Microbacterium paludicola TaxID=300019 RepID=UPI001ADD95FC|nr:carbon-nitrogen hydrolase family protein [Microbacterium paludicola]